MRRSHWDAPLGEVEIVGTREGVLLKRVQPFPVIFQPNPAELVVPPREYGTLVEQPEPRFINS